MKELKIKIVKEWFNKKDIKNTCNYYSTKYSFMPPQKRVIVIGDVHGDLIMALKAFMIAKLIDNDLNWIGGNTVVVQVGDQIDSCRPTPDYTCEDYNDFPDDFHIMKLFMLLHKKAEAYGGAVISLIGNHELNNVLGDMRYVSKNNLDFFNGTKNRIDAFKPGGIISSYLACNYLSIVVIGSNMFLHGGLMPELLNLIEPNYDLSLKDKIFYINEVVKTWLLGFNKKNHKFMDILLTDQTLSPFWNRSYGTGNISKDICDNIDILKIGKMIIGHTPQVKGINSSCNEKLYRIDGAFSSAFKHILKNNQKSVQILQILNDVDFSILHETHEIHINRDHFVDLINKNFN